MKKMLSLLFVVCILVIGFAARSLADQDTYKPLVNRNMIQDQDQQLNNTPSDLGLIIASTDPTNCSPNTDTTSCTKSGCTWCSNRTPKCRAHDCSP